MVSESDAYRFATSALNRRHDDPEAPWQLVEFPEGWLIRDSQQRRGSVTRVVERDSGRVLQFPSSLPPRLVRTEYSEVVAEGRVEFDPAKPTD
jgi:hypothetical protein